MKKFPLKQSTLDVIAIRVFAKRLGGTAFEPFVKCSGGELWRSRRVNGVVIEVERVVARFNASTGAKFYVTVLFQPNSGLMGWGKARIGSSNFRLSLRPEVLERRLDAAFDKAVVDACLALHEAHAGFIPSADLRLGRR